MTITTLLFFVNNHLIMNKRIATAGSNKNTKIDFKGIIFLDSKSGDAVFEVEASSLNGLFEKSALALTSLMVNVNVLSEENKEEVKLKNKKLDMLLYDFLSELLFLKDSKFLLFKSFKISILNEGNEFWLSASLKGSKIDSIPKSAFKTEVKAITLHDFSVQKSDKNWKAKVMVDL